MIRRPAAGGPFRRRSALTLRAGADNNARMKARSSRKTTAPAPGSSATRKARRSQSLALAEQALERTRADLELAHRQLSQKIGEVQALQAALERQAVRDFLTGLFNRRHLGDVMPSMLALAERDRQPLAVAVIDLDHFKAVNDRYGHAVGDMLLAAFGKLLATRMRKSDIACRYGGEAFCLLMPRTDAPTAQRKIAALLKLWRGVAFPIEGAQGRGTLTGLTFSAGISDSIRASGAAEPLLRAADACVLDAQRLGRDRIVVQAVPAPAEPASIPQ